MDETKSTEQLERTQAALKALGAETAPQRRAKQVLPWVSSIAIHAFVILIGFLIPWTTRYLLSNADEPVAVIAEFDELSPAIAMLEDTSDESPDRSSEAMDLAPESVSLTSALNDPLDDQSLDLDLTGPALDDDVLRGFAPGGSGESVTFGGLRGTNAKSIVFVVDASGSMMPYLPIVIDELIASIDRLRDTQNFAVIFFQNNDAVLVPGPDDNGDGRQRRGRTKASLLAANEENKMHVFDWIQLENLNIRATGTSNPVDAIRLALEGLRPDPDVIFILSTDITGVGEFEVDQRDLLQLIDRLNRGRGGAPKAVIKTLQFIDQDPLETLKKIAERNGGPDGYKFLSREELGLN